LARPDGRRLPVGVVNIIAGLGADVGAADGRILGRDGLTGSTRVGKLTMASAANSLKKVSMELGGRTARSCFRMAIWRLRSTPLPFGGFFNAGECCNAGSRLIVHADVATIFSPR
jgi:acyl-CoA reductase-like NAD-dependent aldehyde dehydrogenase